jgi:ribulose kinase
VEGNSDRLPNHRRPKGKEAPVQQKTHVAGVDYGTLSGRALVVRVSDDEKLGTAVHDDPHGEMDAAFAEVGKAMGRVGRGKYQPQPEAAEADDRLFAEYQLLHDDLGRSANDVMKRPQAMRKEALA